MKPPSRRAIFGFLIRFAIFFGALLAPIPRLADYYTTLFSLGGNCLIFMLNEDDDRFKMHLDPPDAIHSQGSWGLTLRVLDRNTGEVATPKLNVRVFSYLPISMYVALTIASLHLAWRRWQKVLGIGLLLMMVVTTALCSLPILAKFGQAGAIGKVPAVLAETLYQAFATPIMLYAIPLLIWWALITRTRPVNATGK